ncbi:MAG: hypothetical protein NZ922_00950 [Candidatus Methanomethyliaceae archaeon]|nr:hypothetical protein [Candidatus Methanomethyliaceae archaeon]MDW7970255.1 hypothetical protein [Nitrososphaerota archaeon]
MRYKVIIGFMVAFLLTIYSGAYSAEIRKSEIVHFWVAVPAGNITHEKIIRDAGPPIRVTPLIIDLDGRGFLKKLLQPNIEAISTHWIYNVGKRPINIRLELIESDIPIVWEVKANWPYNSSTRTFTAPIPPGGRIDLLSIDWYFIIPEYYMDEKIIYDGGLLIYDANSNELLTFIPIMIIRSYHSYIGGECC